MPWADVVVGFLARSLWAVGLSWMGFVLVGSAMGLYVDLRARTRMRTGDLPRGVPMLFLRFQPDLSLAFYVFSSAFRLCQDRSTRWLVWPVRLWFAVQYALFATVALVVVVAGWSVWITSA